MSANPSATARSLRSGCATPTMRTRSPPQVWPHSAARAASGALRDRRRSTPRALAARVRHPPLRRRRGRRPRRAAGRSRPRSTARSRRSARASRSTTRARRSSPPRSRAGWPRPASTSTSAAAESSPSRSPPASTPPASASTATTRASPRSTARSASVSARSSSTASSRSSASPRPPPATARVQNVRLRVNSRRARHHPRVPRDRPRGPEVRHPARRGSGCRGAASARTTALALPGPALAHRLADLRVRRLRRGGTPPARRARASCSPAAPVPELNLGGGFGIAYTSADDVDARSPRSRAEFADVVAAECARLGIPVPVVAVEPGRVDHRAVGDHPVRGRHHQGRRGRRRLDADAAATSASTAA